MMNGCCIKQGQVQFFGQCWQILENAKNEVFFENEWIFFVFLEAASSVCNWQKMMFISAVLEYKSKFMKMWDVVVEKVYFLSIFKQLGMGVCTCTNLTL
jgi:hypothetical protein